MARILISVSLLAMALLWASPASAQGDFVLVSDKTTLTRGDDTDTFSVSIINLTGTDATVTAASGECGVAVKSGSTIKVGRQTAVEVEVTRCRDKDSISVALTVVGGAAKRDFEVEATAKAPRPNWPLIPICYVVAGVVFGAAILSVRGYALQDSTTSKPWRPWAGTALPGLSAEWKFKETWASNVTLVAAAFTTVFGASGGLDSLLGEDAKSFFALITVTSAISVGLVGAAPLLLLATKNNDDQVTVTGLVGASILVLTATSGELGVVVIAAVNELPVHNATKIMLSVLGILGMVLILLYGIRSVRQSLRTGLKDPKIKPKPTKRCRPQISPDGLRRRHPLPYPTVRVWPTGPGDSLPTALL